MRWLPSSLSSRLLAVFLLTAIAAVILMASLFSRGLGSQWRSAIVPHLFQYVSYIQTDLGDPPSEERARALIQHLPIQIQTHDRQSGKLVFTTRQRALPIDRLHFTALPLRRLSKNQATLRSALAELKDITISDDRRQPILRFNQGDYQVYLEFERPRSRDSGMAELLLALGGLATLLCLCYLCIRHLLKPIGKLQSTVQKISEGDLTARANAKGSDDLAVLAHSVDRMSKRIQQMLDAKRELLLAISHELRSPLTRARVATELLDPSRHQQKLVADIDEMESLIARLVESERLQSHVVLDLQEVDLAQLISETVNALDKEIDWQAPQTPIIITADETRLQVLFKNVIANALQHGKHLSDENADVSVHLQQEDNEIRIVVVDRGPGVDADQLAKITEPFYRTDGSRTRKTGGIGLGLYLSKRTAEAHGGSLEIENRKPENTGLEVTVRLPRS
jgi:signal transduction histidine kinase